MYRKLRGVEVIDKKMHELAKRLGQTTLEPDEMDWIEREPYIDLNEVSLIDLTEDEAKYHLAYLGTLALKHWKEHLPTMVKDYQEEGILYRMALIAQEETERRLSALLKKGLPFDLAWEVVSGEQIFLRPEDEFQE